MKHRKHIGRKLLGIILSVVMMVGLMPNLSMTAEASGNLTVTYRTDGNGTLSIEDENHQPVTTLTAGTEYTITSTPKAGYRFGSIMMLTSSAAPIQMVGQSGTGPTWENLFNDTSTWSYQYDHSGNPGEIEEIYIIFKAEKKCVLASYTLTTGNTALRNWKSWSLSGANFTEAEISEGIKKDSRNWKEIATIEGDTALKDKANASHTYELAGNFGAYEYYMLTVASSQAYDTGSNRDDIEMAKAAFNGYAADEGSIVSLTGNDSSGHSFAFTMPEQNVVAIAGYLPNYKVTYDANGGEGTVPVDSATYIPNASVTVKGLDPEHPLTMSGYRFAGWTMYEEDTSGANPYKVYKNGDQFTINKNAVLYAVWEEGSVGDVSSLGYDGIYDGQEHSIQVLKPEGTTVTYCETENGTYTETQPAYTDVGTHTVYYEVSKAGLDPVKGSEVVKITKRPVTLKMKDQSKEYGSADPEIGWDAFTVLSGSPVEGETAAVTRTSGENAGNYQYQNVTIKHGDKDVSSNYEITSEGAGFLTIHKKTVTVSGIAAAAKVYDGNTSATLIYDNVSFAKKDGDDVSVTATGTFHNKNAGQNKTVTISDIILEGEASANYELAASGQQTTCTADITKKTVTVTEGITAENKPFDNNTAAALICGDAVLDGKVFSDNLSVTAVGTFEDAGFGTNKNVMISNLALVGDDAGNYQLAAGGHQASCTASIVNAVITVNGIRAKDRAYDGTNNAELDYSDMEIVGVKPDDAGKVSITATGRFVDKAAGKDKRVNITDYIITGEAKDHYAISVTGTQASATATISRKEVTVSGMTAMSKVYDGKTDAFVEYSKASYGKVGEDDFKIAAAAGIFTDKNAGKNKKVLISGITFSGADASNYVLKSGAVAETTADITECPVTVSGMKAKTKRYDGNAEAEIDGSGAVINGVKEGDTLTFTAVGAFADKSAGSGKDVHLTSLNLAGEDAQNYVISGSQNYTVKGDITAKEVVVSGIEAEDKIYDGTTEVRFNYDSVEMKGLDGGTAVIGEDQIGVDAAGAFEEKDSGRNKKVGITKITITGIDAGNYTLAAEGQQADCTADINRIPVSVSGITAENKIYDGRLNAVLDFSGAMVTGVQEGDKVYVSAAGEFEDANAGDGKTVKLRSVELTGKDAANYEFAAASQTECKADIKPAAVTVSGIAAESKEYDDNEIAALSFDEVKITGVLKSDQVSVSAKGTFTDKYPGEGKEVVISDLTLTGQAAANYVFAENGKQEKATADITLAKGTVIDEVENGDGTKTVKEVGYKDGQPTNKVTEITYGENGVDHIQKTTYDEKGQPQKTVTISMDTEGEISQVVIKNAEGEELVCNDETQVSYGGQEETVEGIKENLIAAGVTDNQVGSVLDTFEITPGEMAYLLKDAASVDELLTAAVNAGESDEAIGGAKVAAAGFDGALHTSSEEILKLTLTPTEIIQMLASAGTTDVDFELSEAVWESEDNTEEKQKIAELVKEDEDVFSFQCDLYKSVPGSEERARVTEFAKALEAGFRIPENLRKENRSYRLIGSHEDAATGEITAGEIALSVDGNYNASFATDKLCLMALVYTDDEIKSGKAAEKEAAEAEAAEKEAAEKAAAEKEQLEKEMAEKEKAEAEKAAAEKEAARKAEEEKQASRKAVAEKAAAMKEETEKEQAEREAARRQAEEKAAAEKAAAEKAAAEKAAAEKAAAEKAAAEKAAAEKAAAEKAAAEKAAAEKAAAEKAAAEKAAAEKAAELALVTVTPEDMDKNSLLLNAGLKVVQKASQIDITWGKVDACENYDVYVQYCGKDFSEIPDATLDRDTTSVSISKVGGRKLKLKKNYKIYIVAYRTVKEKKIVLAKSILAHVVGRKNAKYTNAKSIKILSGTSLVMSVKDVSLIKAKTARVAKKKKLLTDAHAKEFRYASSDRKVATVSKTGIIKAVGKGSCTVYVYSRNGYAKKIYITVK